MFKLFRKNSKKNGTTDIKKQTQMEPIKQEPKMYNTNLNLIIKDKILTISDLFEWMDKDCIFLEKPQNPTKYPYVVINDFQHKIAECDFVTPRMDDKYCNVFKPSFTIDIIDSQREITTARFDIRQSSMSKIYSILQKYFAPMQEVKSFDPKSCDVYKLYTDHNLFFMNNEIIKNGDELKFSFTIRILPHTVMGLEKLLKEKPAHDEQQRQKNEVAELKKQGWCRVRDVDPLNPHILQNQIDLYNKTNVSKQLECKQIGVVKLYREKDLKKII